eukprot:80741-Pleurochrysis_carterae.AAC.1
MGKFPSERLCAPTCDLMHFSSRYGSASAELPTRAARSGGLCDAKPAQSRLNACVTCAQHPELSLALAHTSHEEHTERSVCQAMMSRSGDVQHFAAATCIRVVASPPLRRQWQYLSCVRSRCSA